MLALTLIAAIGTSPPADVIVFDVLEHNQYAVSRFEYAEDAPHQTILWREGRITHWWSGTGEVLRDGEGCWSIVDGRVVRALRYRRTWSYDDPETEERWLNGGNGWTTQYRKTPSQW